MVNDFEEKLETLENPDGTTSPKTSYSQAYRQFKKDNISNLNTTYERLANWSGKIFSIKVKEKERINLEKYINLSHLNIKPEHVGSFAIISAIPFLIGAVFAFVLTGSMFYTGLLFAAAIFALYYGTNLPKTIFNSWRAKASDQLLIAVLYVVIYMKKEPNLERALLFVANQRNPPLSLDFMKILWNFETKKYSTVSESLEVYLETWKDSEPAFVDAMHLVESSLSEPNSEKAKGTLEKATEVIMTGIQDNMTHFAHNLQSPVQLIHMMGIVLPLLMLVMLPMVGAFLADSFSAMSLIVVYNITLPLVVYFMSTSVLSTRPGGATVTNAKLERFKPSKKYSFFAAGFFSLLAIPALLIITSLASKGWDEFKFTNSLFYLSVLLIFAAGIAFYIYYHFRNKQRIEIRNKTVEIEDQFSSAIFQLGNRLGENIPAEAVFAHVAEATKGSEVSNFFSTIDSNIRQRGMSLEDAIFDNKSGAIISYPSNLIESVMRLLLDSVKKSPTVAADAMTTLSLYLQKMHQVKERMTDLLSDTISSMKMQVSFLAPLIAALVISLSVLITKVLTGLSAQADLLSGEGLEQSEIGLGAGVTSIFNVEASIPPYLLQLMVGVYIIQIVFLLSYLISGIINGSSKIDFEWTVAKNMLSATLTYCGLVILGTIIFSAIADVVTVVVT